MKLIDPIFCLDNQFATGLLFVQGAGYRVGVFEAGSEVKHMSAAAARRLAKSLAEDAETNDELSPVREALEAVADRLDAITPGNSTVH